jgi:isoleucyl-tRNA synthetase
MSKSLGNYVPFDRVLKEKGAEILRLWVASSDYRDDIRVSPQILDGLAEGYRKIRNTLRYALGNLYDFNPQKDTVDRSQWDFIDRWAMVRLNRWIAKVRKSYEEYEFHSVYHASLEFCAVDLSATYFDILKDRLYTFAPHSVARRSAQTVLYQIAFDLLRLLAPIMSFTCEEAYNLLPHHQQDSVFLCGLPSVDPQSEDEALVAQFDKLFMIRSEVQKCLEVARREKQIGSSLEAKVVLAVGPDNLLENRPVPLEEWKKLLAAHQSNLPTIFIVSAVELSIGPLENATSSNTLPLQIRIERAPGKKCPRCWNYNQEIDESHPVCPKCAQALSTRMLCEKEF